jgi:K+ transporter
LFTSLSVFGAALLFGDGIITPAISVVSAVEGLKVATPMFQPFIAPIAIVILLLLFLSKTRDRESWSRFWACDSGLVHRHWSHQSKAGQAKQETKQ